MEEMNSLLTVIFSVVVPCVTTSIIIPLVSSYRSVRLRRAEKKIYGVVGRKLAPSLKHLQDYTDYKKAVYSPERKVVLHCRTLSYALRHCDFVCANPADDIKIYEPDDPRWDSLVDQ